MADLSDYFIKPNNFKVYNPDSGKGLVVRGRNGKSRIFIDGERGGPADLLKKYYESIKANVLL